MSTEEIREMPNDQAIRQITSEVRHAEQQFGNVLARMNEMAALAELLANATTHDSRAVRLVADQIVTIRRDAARLIDDVGNTLIEAGKINAPADANHPIPCGMCGHGEDNPNECVPEGVPCKNCGWRLGKTVEPKCHQCGAFLDPDIQF